MRYAMIMAVAALLISSPLGIGYAQEIYWDPGEQLNGTITDKDFDFSLESPSGPKTLSQLEVYDTGEPADLSDIQEAPVAAAAPIRPRSTIESPAGRETTRSPRSTLPRSLRQELNTERAPTASVKQQQKRRGAPVPAVAGQEDRPETKKMEWGKVEVKTVEPQSSGKLQWGRQK